MSQTTLGTRIVPGTLTLLAVLIALAPISSAICTQAYLLDTKPVISNPNLPDKLYMYTEGKGPATGARFAGAFWSMGKGDPRLGLGADSGGFSSDGWANDYYTTDGGGYARPTYLTVLRPPGALHWAASESIDGCVTDGVPTAMTCTCMLLEDGWPDGSYFAVLGDQDNNLDNFDFGEWTPSDVTRLVPIPGPVVTAFTPDGDGANVTVEVARPEGGIYVDPDCTGCSDVRYVVHQAVVPRRSDEPVEPLAGGTFKPVAGQPAEGTPLGDSVELVTSCGDAANEVLLAIQIRADSGFTTRYVSSDVWRLHCDSAVSRPDKPASRVKPSVQRGGAKRDLERRRP